MLFVSPDHPLDPLTIRILEAVDGAARELGLHWFVAGAMVRDILLTGVFGLNAGRATRDVDFAVAVTDWDEFERLKRCLADAWGFRAAASIPHRLQYTQPALGNGYPIDIIPFGGVQQKGARIVWPPDMNVIMNVAGYDDALAAAVEVKISESLVVRVASLPNLAALKILAWHDRGLADARDAIDLATLFRNYADAGNADRLYGSELAVLDAVDYRLELAAPRLLGIDVRRSVSEDVAKQLSEVLAAGNDRIVLGIARGLPGKDDSIAEAQSLLDEFVKGLADVSRQPD